MKTEDVVMGQTYRIRQWDDMAAEFGLGFGGAMWPVVGQSFQPQMVCMCGDIYTPIGMEMNWNAGGFEPTHKDRRVYPFMLEPLPTEDPEEVMG